MTPIYIGLGVGAAVAIAAMIAAALAKGRDQALGQKARENVVSIDPLERRGIPGGRRLR